MKDGLLFSDKHIWVFVDGKSAKIGISDYAQKKLKSIMFVNLPEIGEVIKKDERIGDIESIKTVSDIISPVSGKVISVNDLVVDDPSQINEEPYDSWFIEVELEELSDGLINKEEYESNL